jgi:Transcription factor zinc-finger
LASKLRDLLYEITVEVKLWKVTRIDSEKPCAFSRKRKKIFTSPSGIASCWKSCAQLRRVEKVEAETHCPKCPGKLESYTFQGIALDRCHECGGIWLDKGELEEIVRKISRGPLGAWLDTLAAKL